MFVLCRVWQRSDHCAIRTYSVGAERRHAELGYIVGTNPDGYFWLGGTEGLYRFDGVVFEHYQPQSGGPFPVSSVSQLFALPNGDLWIVFRTGGICLLRNGFATIYTARDGVPTGAIWGLAQDREGTIWAAAESGLSRLQGRRWKYVGKDWNFPGKSAAAIFLDRGVCVVSNK
jgi:ligand-binding sensor domain-containing protein